jgi:hypothetical protein
LIGGLEELSQISKTLEYRRARFNDPEQNLEALTRAAWGAFGSHVDRAVVRGGDHAIVAGMRSRDEGQLGFSVYGARFYEGQGVGVIPMVPAVDVDLGERNPEENENFLSSDFLAVIRGNHVICLNCGRNGGALRTYLSLLFKKADMPNEAQKFELVRVGNPDKLPIIQAIGVKRVEMKVGISEAAAMEIIDGQAPGRILQDWQRRSEDSCED